MIFQDTKNTMLTTKITVAVLLVSSARSVRPCLFLFVAGHESLGESHGEENYCPQPFGIDR